ncbi:hypothetical protein JAO76_00125 [Pontibacter sp. BT310]|jgi:hypothetical protein|uniref:tRNA (Guanine-N1)-methyltransferase n=1 Tax=Pontibacter populi TaxID=890055 RepID=A0ABS6X611_9BACT|nr:MULTISPECIES: hypothetical protein [Pontibacter]MBJ6116579.1 hypothetical protein [Pontibacter sp. BT310]MBR0569003.1 hypothetical protein [Microvirga sp. STS03]MBW3363432.1 hypothetical protein [Pontibacter populi]
MKSTFLSFILVVMFTAVQAQSPAPQKAKPAKNSLSSQFDNLKENANSYNEKGQQYKVVNVKTLNNFYNSVNDSLHVIGKKLADARAGADKELIDARASVEAQEKQLKALTEETARKELEVQKSQHLINNISFFGIDMGKQFYVILNSVIIVALLLILAIVMMQYKSSKSTTTEKVKAFNDIDNEFNEYKKAARERELKLKREMQTEFNRAEELSQQLAALQKKQHV